MKKRLAALLCAAMLTAVLPVLAWAGEADGPAADQAAAPTREAADRPIEPRQMRVMGDRSEVLGETSASDFGIIATTEWVDDSLREMPTYRVEAKKATKKMDFAVALADEYADCAKIEVHVKPSGGSAGIAKTFEVTRPSRDATFNFTSEIFNLGDQAGDNSYEADFLMAIVPLKGAFDEPAADVPAAEAGSGIDTGAKSPKTGLNAGAVAGGSAALLVGAATAAVALRRKLRA